MEQEWQEPSQGGEPPPQTMAGISGKEVSQSSEFCGDEPQRLCHPLPSLWVHA